MLSAYSHSSLKTFRECPRKFKFQYIEKPEIPKEVSAEAYLGNAVHRVLQLLYTRGSDGVELPLTAAVERYQSEWDKVDRDKVSVVSDYMGVDDYIRVGREMLEKHYERYRPFRHGTLLGTEQFLSFTLPGTSFKLRAVVDRLWRRDDGVVEICDYKTGRHLPRPDDIDFFYQMGIYELAVRENFPQFDTIETAQYFLRLDEEVRRRMRPDELDALVEDVRVAILSTLRAAKFDDYPTNESSLCNWCEYFHLCPAKRHRAMLEDEKSDNRPAAEQMREKASEYIAKYRQEKQLRAELDALKNDLIQLSNEEGLTKFVGEGGSVSITVRDEEKFITKTDAADEFADLSEIVRKLGLDTYFKLDGVALMKDIFQNERVDRETLEVLKKYVRVRTSTVTRVKLDKPQDDADKLES